MSTDEKNLLLRWRWTTLTPVDFRDSSWDMIMKKRVFHLLPNAHLDPVWLWDWREVLSEAIITTRTVLDLMDEYPDFTFMRGLQLMLSCALSRSHMKIRYGHICRA